MGFLENCVYFHSHDIINKSLKQRYGDESLNKNSTTVSFRLLWKFVQQCRKACTLLLAIKKGMVIFWHCAILTVQVFSKQAIPNCM